MPVNRLERVNALLKRVIGEAVFRVMQTDDVSPGLITVTGVSCGKDLRNATVRVSVFGDEALQKRALGHLVHHEREFQQIVNREVRLKFTPQLRSVLDHSLENRAAPPSALACTVALRGSPPHVPPVTVIRPGPTSSVCITRNTASPITRFSSAFTRARRLTGIRGTSAALPWRSTRSCRPRRRPRSRRSTRRTPAVR